MVLFSEWFPLGLKGNRYLLFPCPGSELISQTNGDQIVSIVTRGTWLRNEGQTSLLLVLPQYLSAVLTLGLSGTWIGFGPAEQTHVIRITALSWSRAEKKEVRQISVSVLLVPMPGIHQPGKVMWDKKSGVWPPQGNMAGRVQHGLASSTPQLFFL